MVKMLKYCAVFLGGGFQRRVSRMETTLDTMWVDFYFLFSRSIKDYKTTVVPQHLQQRPCCHVLFRTPTDILEKLAEQNYSQNQLRDLNAKMRQWLDVADDELVTLRSENTHLKKQVHT